MKEIRLFCYNVNLPGQPCDRNFAWNALFYAMISITLPRAGNPHNIYIPHYPGNA